MWAGRKETESGDPRPVGEEAPFGFPCAADQGEAPYRRRVREFLLRRFERVRRQHESDGRFYRDGQWLLREELRRTVRGESWRSFQSFVELVALFAGLVFLILNTYRSFGRYLR
jgi:hypothetical protein